MNEEEVLEILQDPFGRVETLSDNEREAANILARGGSLKTVEVSLGVATKTSYRTVDRAVKKIGKYLDREITREDLPKLVHDFIREKVTP